MFLRPNGICKNLKRPKDLESSNDSQFEHVLKLHSGRHGQTLGDHWVCNIMQSLVCGFEIQIGGHFRKLDWEVDHL